MEVGIGREILADQAGAHDGAVAGDQAAIGLGSEGHLGEPRDGQGIGEARKGGEQDDHDDRGAQVGQHGDTQARWRTETARSMILMPMNGATMPPSP